MSDIKNWTNVLLSLILVAMPALVLFFFLLPDWHDEEIISRGYMFLVAAGYVIGSTLLFLPFIFLKIVDLNAYRFAFPLALVFGVILVSYGIPSWGRILLVIGTIFVAWPVNIIIENLVSHKNKL